MGGSTFYSFRTMNMNGMRHQFNRSSSPIEQVGRQINRLGSNSDDTLEPLPSPPVSLEPLKRGLDGVETGVTRAANLVVGFHRPDADIAPPVRNALTAEELTTLLKVPPVSRGFRRSLDEIGTTATIITNRLEELGDLEGTLGKEATPRQTFEFINNSAHMIQKCLEARYIEDAHFSPWLDKIIKGSWDLLQQS